MVPPLYGSCSEKLSTELPLIQLYHSWDIPKESKSGHQELLAHPCLVQHCSG